MEIEQAWNKNDQTSIQIRFQDEHKQINLDTDRGFIVAAFVTCTISGGTSTPSQVNIAFADGSLGAVSFLKSKLKWMREDGLADIAAVQLVDAANRLNGDEDVIDPDLPQLGKKTDLLEQFIRRIRRHANQMHSFLRHLVAVKDIASYFIGQGESNLDQFGIRKVIVAVTNNDKIYGLDSKNGNILWQFMVPGGIELTGQENPMYLFLQRPANYYGMDAKCSVLYRNKKSGVMQVLSFNPLNGRFETSDIRSFGENSIVKAFLLHHSTEDNVRPLVVLNRNNQVMVEPENAIGEIKSLSGKIYYASISKDSDRITGQRLLVTKGNIKF